jgi:hypothetical protein
MLDLNTLSTWVAIRAQSDLPAPVRSPGPFRLFPAGTSVRTHALRRLIGLWRGTPRNPQASPCPGRSHPATPEVR